MDTGLVPVNGEVTRDFVNFSDHFNINQDLSFHFFKVLHCNLGLSAGFGLDKAHASEEMLAPVLHQRDMPAIRYKEVAIFAFRDPFS